MQCAANGARVTFRREDKYTVEEIVNLKGVVPGVRMLQVNTNSVLRRPGVGQWVNGNN